MLNKVSHYIQSQQLLDPAALYLVAVSGGADSVCLLLMLKKLGYTVEAVHCNFNLRGNESLRDEQFVSQLCQTNNVELHIIHFDTATYAKLHKVSIEMAARQLRYRYFEQLRRDIGAQGICVAHHQDDSAETILMNLVRGTGLRGLTGIKPQVGHILRPLLCCRRTEIEAWLQQQGQAYVTDSTNLEDNIIRNCLRLDIIPQLQTLVPQATANILRSSQRLSQALRIYDAYIEAKKAELIEADSICISQLLQQTSPESILFEWLTPLHFTPATIERIFASLAHPQGGRTWQSATHQVIIHQGRLMAQPLQAPLPTLVIPEAGTYVYHQDQKIKVQTLEGPHIEQGVISLDAARVAFPLTVRPIAHGDRFRPIGMKGTKLVSDYLADRHQSLFQRQRTLALCNGAGHIIALLGHCPDDAYKITAQTTKTLLIKLLED